MYFVLSSLNSPSATDNRLSRLEYLNSGNDTINIMEEEYILSSLKIENSAATLLRITSKKRKRTNTEIPEHLLRPPVLEKESTYRNNSDEEEQKIKKQKKEVK